MGFALGCHKSEQEAILKLKGSVYSDPANRLSSWKGEDCCNWHGVTCHNVSHHVLRLDLHTDSIFLNACFDDYDYHEKVEECEMLRFQNMSPSLLELKELSYLDLSGNDFNGSRIPEFIGSMKNWRYLNLSNAGFSGIVPSQIGNLTRLQALDLGNIQVNWLPNNDSREDNFQWLSKLINLKYLDLSGNNYNMSENFLLIQVVMTLPSMLDLRFSSIMYDPLLLDPNAHGNFFNLNLQSSIMQHLDLSFNSLEGSFPKFLFNMRSLEFLDLSGNSFKGQLPHCLCNMRSLKYLDLSSNQFEGPIPLWIKNIRRLEVLKLGKNSFSHVEGGSIKGILGNLCYLKVLDFSYNYQLGGDILSPYYANYSSKCISYELEILNLSSINITTTLPYWLGDLKNLKTLVLVGNRGINGPIPQSIGNLSLLEGLNMRGCGLYGSIPSSIGKLSSLKILDLSSNFLKGYLSDSHFSNLSSLWYISLSSNNLSGYIPSSIGSMSSLTNLDLKLNSFKGSLSDSHFANLSSVWDIDLSFNLISGFVPSSIGSLSSLRRLNFTSNSFEGPLSDSHFSNLSRLQYLDLSFNPLSLNLCSHWLPKFQLIKFRMRSCKIKDIFPQWIKTQTELTELDLSNNEIHGELPWWFPSPNLGAMNLSRNQIVGPIPRFSSSSQLSSMDLSYNSLSGSLLHDQHAMNGLVKASLCKLRNLEFLNLRRNQLSGEILDCWRNLEYLYVIDMSYNKLSGSIPKTIGLLQYLGYLKLNSNSLVGKIPATMNVASSLRILDLGENNLTGEVPNWDADTHPYLRILRLRANQLKGFIPPKLCSLSRIQFLDLAQNNLTGIIPSCFGRFMSMKSFSYNRLDFDAMAPQPEVYAMAPIPQASSEEANAMVVLKGAERQYTTNLKFVVDLDLSCNDLVGSIPEELVQLVYLNGLNLSYNHLTGIIPDKIGEMRSLESLDLSNNDLSGTIPSSLSALTSLSTLNLSCNKLHGEIPTGDQLRTLNDPSIYSNNAGLCGDPLPSCKTKTDKQQEPEKEEEEGESKFEKVMFILVVMLGFATGFWGVVGSLLLNKAWRQALFQHVKKFIDFLYVQIVVRIKRLKILVLYVRDY